MVLFQNNTYPWERKCACACVCVCVCVHACMCACMCVCNITCKSNRSKTLSTIHADAWGNLCSTAKQKSPPPKKQQQQQKHASDLPEYTQARPAPLSHACNKLYIQIRLDKNQTNPTCSLCFQHTWLEKKQTQLAVYVSNTPLIGQESNTTCSSHLQHTCDLETRSRSLNNYGLNQLSQAQLQSTELAEKCPRKGQSWRFHQIRNHVMFFPRIHVKVKDSGIIVLCFTSSTVIPSFNLIRYKDL